MRSQIAEILRKNLRGSPPANSYLRVPRGEGGRGWWGEGGRGYPAAALSHSLSWYFSLWGHSSRFSRIEYAPG